MNVCKKTSAIKTGHFFLQLLSVFQFPFLDILQFIVIFLYYSLFFCAPAGFFLCAPHTPQSSGSGTHLTAAIQSTAFSLDASQRQRAAHQSLALETEGTDAESLSSKTNVCRHCTCMSAWL